MFASPKTAPHFGIQWLGVNFHC